jgi:hypothetical protein
MNYSSRLPASCSGVRGEAESVGWFREGYVYYEIKVLFNDLPTQIELTKFPPKVLSLE